MARTTRLLTATLPFAKLFREKKGKARLRACVCMVMRVVSSYVCERERERCSEWNRIETYRDIVVQLYRSEPAIQT